MKSLHISLRKSPHRRSSHRSYRRSPRKSPHRSPRRSPNIVKKIRYFRQDLDKLTNGLFSIGVGSGLTILGSYTLDYFKNSRKLTELANEIDSNKKEIDRYINDPNSCKGSSKKCKTLLQYINRHVNVIIADNNAYRKLNGGIPYVKGEDSKYLNHYVFHITDNKYVQIDPDDEPNDDCCDGSPALSMAPTRLPSTTTSGLVTPVGEEEVGTGFMTDLPVPPPLRARSASFIYGPVPTPHTSPTKPTSQIGKNTVIRKLALGDDINFLTGFGTIRKRRSRKNSKRKNIKRKNRRRSRKRRN